MKIDNTFEKAYLKLIKENKDIDFINYKTKLVLTGYQLIDLIDKTARLSDNYVDLYRLEEDNSIYIKFVNDLSILIFKRDYLNLEYNAETKLDFANITITLTIDQLIDILNDVAEHSENEYENDDIDIENNTILVDFINGKTLTITEKDYLRIEK